MTKNMMTFAQRTAINDKLKEVCAPGDNGLAEYAKGWDDAMVAQAIGAPVKKANVMSIRKEMFGLVRGPKPAAPKPDARLAALEERVRKLEARLI